MGAGGRTVCGRQGLSTAQQTAWALREGRSEQQNGGAHRRWRGPPDENTAPGRAGPRRARPHRPDQAASACEKQRLAGVAMVVARRLCAGVYGRKNDIDAALVTADVNNRAGHIVRCLVAAVVPRPADVDVSVLAQAYKRPLQPQKGRHHSHRPAEYQTS